MPPGPPTFTKHEADTAVGRIVEVKSRKLSKPVGVFSQAIKVDRPSAFVFVSGLTARAADGSVVGEGDIRVQTETVLELLKAILQEAGGGLADVVKVTVYLRNMAHFKEVHEVRGRYFSQPYPASTMVEVSRLVEPGHLIEIEAVAVLG